MLNFIIIVGVLVWVMTSITFAATMGAAFAPDKPKIISRSIISLLLLIPSLFVVPLGFAAGIILSIIIFIVGITIFGVRIACELIKDGIPEMDEDGNYIEKETEQTTVSPPWV
jgi:hypothetical protein|tara:strand:- start:431 stop:769 length:339 start_codon:yes stop_codon:yes gene_type:complete